MSPSETKYYNSKTAELVSVFLNIAPDFIDIDAVLEISKDCCVTPEYAYAEMLAAVCNVDSQGKDRAYFKNYFLPMVHELSAAEFLNNPYHKNIKTDGVTKGKY